MRDAAALAVLVALVGVFGEALEQIPLPMLQIFVGALLLIFGTYWFGEGAGHCVARPGSIACGARAGLFRRGARDDPVMPGRRLKAFDTAASEAGR